MNNSLIPNSLKTLHNPAAVILWSGMITGLLDAAAGVIVYFLFKSLNPIEVLQYIASGVFGAEAFQGGLAMALFGLVFHFLIAFAFSAAYFGLGFVLPTINKNPLVTGLLYGSFVWLFMNFLVLPNSNITLSGHDFVSVLELVWHAILVGVPTAFITAWYYEYKLPKLAK